MCVGGGVGGQGSNRSNLSSNQIIWYGKREIFMYFSQR